MIGRKTSLYFMGSSDTQIFLICHGEVNLDITNGTI